MNKYFAIASLILFIVWSGFMYYEGTSKEHALCTKADAVHDLKQAGITLAAENGVIATVGQQQTITQGVDNAYQTQKNSIDGKYATYVGSVWGQPAAPATHSMPAPSSTPSRPNAATARPFRTLVFGLTENECDDNTEQLESLQDWVRKQTALKPTH